MSQTILTERLLLRRWRDEDRLPFSKINADPRVMEFMPACLSPVESDALIARIEDHFDVNGFGPFAVELLESKSLVGFVGLFIPSFEAHFMPAVEIGWRLAAELFEGELGVVIGRRCRHVPVGRALEVVADLHAKERGRCFAKASRRLALIALFRLPCRRIYALVV